MEYDYEDVIRALSTDLDAPKKEMARRRFIKYVEYIDPDFIFGWWNTELCAQLQKFYDDLMAGERPILIIQAPPQHGKSVLVTLFISWLAGKNPNLRKIYASFSERLGIRANLALQKIYDSPKYKAIFPYTAINASNTVTVGGQALRNREILEYVAHKGYFRNTTVGGSITGESLDIGIIDDPIKGREEANSEKIREKVWDWLMDDFMTRFSEFGAMLLVMTRWHPDDPAGRLIEAMGDRVKVYSRPAIAVEDEEHRSIGEPLFAKLKSLEFLLMRRAAMVKSSWESLYQQMPFIKGGGLFAIENFQIVKFAPKLKGRPVRYWDKAATQDGGAYTAGVKLCKTDDGQFIVLDVRRKQLSPLKREKLIKATAELDGKETIVMIEREGGSGGKESADATIRNLAGFVVEADRVTGSKEDRAEPYAAQVEGENILLLEAPWNKDFIDEHELFPDGTYKDQVDAAAGAFNKIAGKPVLGFTDKQKRDITNQARATEKGQKW